MHLRYLKLLQKTRPEKKKFIMKMQNQRSFRTYTQREKDSTVRYS